MGKEKIIRPVGEGFDDVLNTILYDEPEQDEENASDDDQE